MDVQQLSTLYPQATVRPDPPVTPNTVAIQLASGQYFCIDTTNLGARERALLNLLSPAPVSPTDTDHWSCFLLGKTTTVPTNSAKQLQVIHFRVRFTDTSQPRTAWLSALADLFNDVLHRAFTAEDAGYLLLKTPLPREAQSDLAGLLAVLDNDFYTNTQILIGSHHPDAAALPAAFSLEEHLFSRDHRQPVTRLSTLVLPDLVHAAHSELTALSNEQLADPDNQQLIAALYHTQGNVRQAAAHLFVHRNTLLYRIDKFERTSGFDLKSMDDLVYCYLLTLAQTPRA